MRDSGTGAITESAPQLGAEERRAVRVAVCIATCERPEGLRRLLDGLELLAFVKVPAPELRIIVVENGVPSGARDLCAGRTGMSRWRLQYESEPRIGISYARNRAVRCARPWADFVAFIDDDEVPAPDWLDELLHVQGGYQADAVVGPIVRRFEAPVPEWIEQGRFFVQRRRPTGTPRQRASTNNTLIRSPVFDGVGEFDERFALTGGEDTHFFLRAYVRGYLTVWADEAIVHEYVAADRTTAGWLLRRSYRYGNTWSLCERELWPGLRGCARRVGRETLNIIGGAAMLPLRMLGGKVATVKCLRRICEAAGNISGVLGLRYEEYRPSRRTRTHG
jgi:GT2 family glycosyltransferase